MRKTVDDSLIDTPEFSEAAKNQNNSASVSMKVKVISNNPGKLRALQEAGLEIAERVSIEVRSSAPAAKYLKTKKEKMGHLLELSAR